MGVVGGNPLQQGEIVRCAVTKVPESELELRAPGKHQFQRLLERIRCDVSPARGIGWRQEGEDHDRSLRGGFRQALQRAQQRTVCHGERAIGRREQFQVRDGGYTVVGVAARFPRLRVDDCAFPIVNRPP